MLKYYNEVIDPMVTTLQDLANKPDHKHTKAREDSIFCAVCGEKLGKIKISHVPTKHTVYVEVIDTFDEYDDLREACDDDYDIWVNNEFDREYDNE